MIDIQSDSVLKKRSFKSANVKTPVVSLLPNAPHQTMRDSHPDNTIMMVTKISLQTCQEINHNLWHCPVYTKQGEHHRNTTQKQQDNVIKIDLPTLPYFCTYNTNPESPPSSYVNYQQSKQFPKLQSKQKMRLCKEPLVSKYFSKGRTKYIHPTKPDNNYSPQSPYSQHEFNTSYPHQYPSTRLHI